MYLLKLYSMSGGINITANTISGTFFMRCSHVHATFAGSSMLDESNRYFGICRRLHIVRYYRKPSRLEYERKGHNGTLGALREIGDPV